MDSITARSIFIAACVAVVGCFDMTLRIRRKKTRLLSACVLGTVLAYGLITVGKILLRPGGHAGAQVMACAFVLVIIGWSVLFGPWSAKTKAAVLGFFVFWVSFAILMEDTPQDRLLRVVAALVALIPACIWCGLFLRYHTEKISRVLMMFFGGMLSTVPILFYDALVRSGTEFEFFLFRIIPQNFSATSQSFVTGQLGVTTSVHRGVLVSLLSFFIVGLIEECSKVWVIKRNGETMFSSVNEAIELSIIVAIGFAFAENVINPSYFMSFVRDYLLLPDTPQIGAFVSNVAGRSILTSMVHILSTGVFGYFYGRAVFAASILQEERKQGIPLVFLQKAESILHVKMVDLYRWMMWWAGMLSAIALHGAFDFLVTIPDILPGQPRSLGELLGISNSFLGAFPLLMFPALFYVVGGFWLLTRLFEERENEEERGHLVRVEAFVGGNA